MSTEIERKVVDMRFENRSFERNVEQSISSLDRLKESLNFNGVSKGLEDVERASSAISFSGLEKGVDTVTAKFSYLQVAIATVVQNITNDITNAVKGWTQQLTTANITAGWDKYAEKTSAVQTIMAATAKDFENQGDQMKYVNEQIERLNWFADETSYSLTDMTSNVGKFTSNNIPLEDAVTSMEGIALAAALAGTNSAGASRAMYNFSQALGVGAVKVQDWMSIENAGMATAEFKQTIIDTALAEKNLIDKNGKYYINTQKLAEATGQSEDALRSYIAGMEGMSETAEGIEVNIENFRTTLAQGWFDSNVLTKTLNKYGAFSDQLSKFYDEMGEIGQDNYTTSELIKMVDKYVALGESEEDVQKKQAIIDELVANTALDAEKASEWIEELSKKEYDLGRRALKAGQEAKTFKEALDSVKDAASTKWSGVFEAIFGDYLEAKEVWTNLANYLYDLFVGPVANILHVFNDWKTAISGIEEEGEDGSTTFLTYQQVLMKAFGNIGRAIEIIKDTIVEAFEAVFGVFNKQNLIQITDAFYKLSEKVILSEEATDKLRDTFIKIFTAITKVWKIVKVVAGVLYTVVSTVAPYIYKVIVAIADGLDTLSKSFKTLATNSKATDFLNDTASSINKFSKALGTDILSGITLFFEKFSNWIQSVNWGKVAEDIWRAFEMITAAVQKIWNALAPILQHFGNFLTHVLNKIADSIASFKDKAQSGQLVEDLKNLWKNLKVVLTALIHIGSIFMDKLSEFVSSNTFGNLLDLIKTISIVSIVTWLKRGGPIYSILEVFEDVGMKFGNAAILKGFKGFGAGCLMLAGALLVLSMVDPNTVETSSQILVDWAVNILAALALFSRIGGKMSMGSSSVFVSISALLLSMAGVMYIMGSWSEEFVQHAKDNMQSAIDMLTSLMLMVGIYALLSKRSKQDRGVVGSILMLIASIGALMLFAKAIEKIGEIPQNVLDKGLKTFATFLLATGLYISMLSDRQKLSRSVKNGEKFDQTRQNITEAVGALVVIVGAMWLLARALTAMKDVSPETIQNAVGAMTALMAALAVFSRIAGKSTKNSDAKGFSKLEPQVLEIAVGVVLLSGALWIFAQALYELDYVRDLDLIWTSAGIMVLLLSAVALISLAIAGLDKLTKNSGDGAIMNVVAFALSAAILAGAMWLVAKALVVLDQEVKSADTIKYGALMIVAMAGAMLLIGAALALVARNGSFGRSIGAAIGLAVGLASLIGALYLFGLVLDTMSQFSAGQIAAGLATIAGLGLIGALIIKCFEHVKATALLKALGTITLMALIIPLVAGGMFLMFKVLEQAPELSEGQAMASILAIVGVLAALGIAIALIAVSKSTIEAVSKVILTLAKALGVLGLALLAIAIAFKLFASISGDEMQTIKANFTQAAKDLPEILGTALAFLPNLVSSVVTSVALAITANQTELTAALTSLGSAIVEALTALTALLVDTIIAVFAGLNANWGKLEDELVTFVENICSLLERVTPKLVEAVLNIVSEILIGIENDLPQWLDSLEGILFEVIDFVFDFLKDLANKFGNGTLERDGVKISSLIGGIVGGLFDSIQHSLEAGLESLKLAGNFIGALIALFDPDTSDAEKKAMWQTVLDNLKLFAAKLALSVVDVLSGVFSGTYFEKYLTKATDWLNKQIDEIESAGDRLEQVRKDEMKSEMKRALLNSTEYMRYMTIIARTGQKTGDAQEEAFNALISKISEYDEAQLSALKDYLYDMVADGEVTGVAASAVRGLIAKVKEMLGIHSPSKVFQEIGEYCVEGLDKGLNSGSSTLADAFGDLEDVGKDIFHDAWANLFGDDSFELKLTVDTSQLETAKSWIMDNLGGSFDISSLLSATGSGLSNAFSGVADHFNANKYGAAPDSSVSPVSNESNSYISNTFNISGSDPSSIADAVMSKMQSTFDRDNAVWKGNYSTGGSSHF